MLSLFLLLLAVVALAAACSSALELEVQLEDASGSTARTNVKQHDILHPAVKPLDRMHKGTGAMSAKFLSLYPEDVEFYYENGMGGTPQGHLSLGQETTTASYEGHVFFFTKLGDKSQEVARFTMRPDQFTYFVEDANHPAPPELVEAALAEKAFSADYLQRTGIHWRHYFGPERGPRPPPSLYMWPAERVGQVHTVDSSEGHWLCGGPANECKAEEKVHMELEVISLAPRAFVIDGFLNDFEVEEVKRLAGPRLARSGVGDGDSGEFESDTRTSLNAWVPRQLSPVVDTLFRRAAHLLRVDEQLLYKRTNAEDLQVVHYTHGQRYDPHHDWGISGYIESRYITLLLYLNDQASADAGGETSFPKAGGGKGIKVHPGKGNAVLFYNLLEDGNGDDLSLHAALPLKEGEKWLANVWVWDPKFK